MPQGAGADALALPAHGAPRSCPPDFDIDTHLTPTYNPWDQRVCMAADGDFFAALRDGSALDRDRAIDRFTPDGVRLADGSELAADIIVTATGLRMMMLGGLELEVDGAPVELGSTIAYKGMMLGGVPEPRLHGRLHERLLDAEGRPGGRLRVPPAVAHARQRQPSICVPRSPREGLPTYPILDLKSGYVLRSADTLPKQAGERCRGGFTRTTSATSACSATVPSTTRWTSRCRRAPLAGRRWRRWPSRERRRRPRARGLAREIEEANRAVSMQLPFDDREDFEDARRGPRSGRCTDGVIRAHRAGASCGTSTPTTSSRASARRASTRASGGRGG